MIEVLSGNHFVFVMVMLSLEHSVPQVNTIDTLKGSEQACSQRSFDLNSWE